MSSICTWKRITAAHGVKSIGTSCMIATTAVIVMTATITTAAGTAIEETLRMSNTPDKLLRIPFFLHERRIKPTAHAKTTETATTNQNRPPAKQQTHFSGCG